MPRTQSSVLSLVSDPALYCALKALSATEQMQVLEDAVRHAVAHRRDDLSASSFKLLTHVIRYFECMPYAVSKTDFHCTLPDTGEVTEALNTAQIKCARTAMTIFFSLSSSILATCPVTAYDLFKEVADCWRNTQSEDTADEMLGHLRKVGISLGSYGTYINEKWDRVLREATGSRFPRKRILRHMLQITQQDSSYKTSDEVLVRILALAWVRECDLKTFAHYLNMMESLQSSMADLPKA